MKNAEKHVVRTAALFALAATSVILAWPSARAASDASSSEKTAKLDPAAWGSDHVDVEPPEYITGEECIFCHRTDVGHYLHLDPHVQTIRDTALAGKSLPGEPSGALAKTLNESEYILGSKKMIRFLREGAGYNLLDLSPHMLKPAPDGDPEKSTFIPHDGPEWDPEKFARDCVGCHATAIDKQDRSYAALGLDCYSCHGDVSLTHTEDTKHILLSRKREDSAEIIASICGQCHLRGGKSRATGLAYPTQFVPGDNLFKDYEVDFSDEHIRSLPVPDRHVYENIRDMVIEGKTRITCLTCHDVHHNTSKVHYGAPASPLCLTCHPAEDPTRKSVIPYEDHSPVCEY